MEDRKIPVSEIVQIENPQYPTLTKSELVSKLTEALEIGDAISIDDRHYRYIGETRS